MSFYNNYTHSIITSIRQHHNRRWAHPNWLRLSHLFTRIFLESLLTYVTMHAATPLKFTSALPLAIDLMGVVAAAAAQQIASFDATCCSITRPSDCAQWAGAQIAITIIGRSVQIDHFQPLWPLNFPCIHDGRSTAPARSKDKDGKLD